MDEKKAVQAVRELSQMTPDELLDEYARVFGVHTMRQGDVFVRRRIAHHIQEIEMGGFTKGELELFGRIASRDPKTKFVTRPRAARPNASDPVRGATYVREYKGKVYEARAAGYGQFDLNGILYPSLTACVKAITGQHYSGKKWFRLKGGL